MTNELLKTGAVATVMLSMSGMLAEGDVDTGKSEIYVYSRSGEEKSPVFGEPLVVRITLRNSAGKPVAGTPGGSIRLFIEGGGKMLEQTFGGKTGANGTIYSAFKDSNISQGAPLKFGAQVDDAILQSVSSIAHNDASEHVAAGQPLWNGSNKIFGHKTTGQAFTCGNITEISRIKVMLNKNTYAAHIALPVLKLYEWRNDYESTVSAQALSTSQPEALENSRDLAVYAIKCQVKQSGRYYFELSIPDGSGDDGNFVNVYRTWRASEGPDSYPEGMAYFNGQGMLKSDLMFYVFSKRQ